MAKSYKFWQQGISIRGSDGKEFQHEVMPYKQLFWAGKLLDGISAPSLVLLNDWKERGAKNTIYVPNYPDASIYLNANRKSNRRIILGWGGSGAHIFAWENTKIAGALKRLVKARPEVLIMIVWTQGIYNLLVQTLKGSENVIFIPKLDFYQWPEILGRMDIGLIPLYGKYDQRRSDIKALEYQLMEIPWISNDGVVYDRVKQYGTIVGDTEKRWLEAMMDHVDNLAAHKSDPKIAAGKEFAISQDARANAQAIIDTYDKIWRAT
jgi:hypothetical protein